MFAKYRRSGSLHLALASVLMCVLTIPAIAEAKIKKAKLSVAPVTPVKMKTFYGSGERVPYPGSAAAIEVYGQGSQYEGVANLAGSTYQPWKVEAVCPLGQTLVRSWLTVNGNTRTFYDINQLRGKGAVMARGYGPAVVSTSLKYSQPDIGVDPVAACNSELATRAAKTGKSRLYWAERGLVIKVDDALRANAIADCSINLLKASATAPVYLACLPTGLGTGKPANKGGGSGPQPRPGKIKVKMLPVTTLYGGKQATTLYYHKCPIPARLEAQVLAPRSMTVRYRYVVDGKKGPVREKQLTKGLQNLPVYNVSLGKPVSAGLALKSKGAGPDASGWASVEILQSGGNLLAKKASYKVYCHDRPKRMPTGKTPAKVSIGKVRE